MSGMDKAKNKVEQVGGALKEKTGEVTGNDKLKNEGQKDKAKGNLKDAGEKVKDAVNP